jgi:glycosyltransferase involved in cell wall biosynthesis
LNKGNDAGVRGYFLKLGLYGGLANNMYVFAKALVKKGLDICFIRDRRDRYPFSQPVWEDVAWTLNYDEVAKATNWRWEEWTEREVKLGWKAPEWLADPLEESEDKRFTCSQDFGFLDRFLMNLFSKKRTYWNRIIALMSRCDILLVCGIESSILALASGKPFIIWPHGGDIRTAAGLHPPRSLNPSNQVKYFLQLRLLRLAYKNALCIGTHATRIWLRKHIGNTALKYEIRVVNMPFQIRQRLSKDKRRDLLSALMKRLQLPMPNVEWVGFVPSRIDFLWKGSNRLFQAIPRVADKGKLHYIVSGWGTNYQEAKQMVSSSQVTFLPCAVSKPVLYDFFRAADFVVDQFLLGFYGTSAIEAMSCGTPVIMWIDKETFQEEGREPPPIFNAKIEEDIIQILTGIISGQIDLEEGSRAAHDWVRRNHSEESAIIPFLKEIQNTTLFKGQIRIKV